MFNVCDDRNPHKVSTGKIMLGDNSELLKAMPDKCCDLIYIDPPFNTQKVQQSNRIKITRDENGTRGGFAGARYKVERQESPSYIDSFDDFMGFIEPRIREAHRLLADDGSFLSYRLQTSSLCRSADRYNLWTPIIQE